MYKVSILIILTSKKKQPLILKIHKKATQLAPLFFFAFPRFILNRSWEYW